MLRSFFTFFLQLSLLSAYGFARDYSCYEPLDEGEIGSRFWRFCGRSEKTSPRGVVELSDVTYTETLGRRTDHFVLKGDSLLWTGYNAGRYLGFVADKAGFVTSEPGLSSLDNAFDYSGKGHQNVTMEFTEEGTFKLQTVGLGCASLVPGDTLRNVILTRQTVTSRFSVEDTLKYAPETATVYRWYAAGSLLPIAIQSDDILYIDYTAGADNPRGDESETKIRERIRKIVDSVQLLTGNGNLTVLMESAINVNIYIMDTPGNIYRHVSGCEDRFSIDISGLPHGRFIVSIVAGPEAFYTRKTILNI